MRNMLFNLKNIIGRLLGIKKDRYSDCLDSAIQIIQNDPNFKSTPVGLSIALGLENIQKFISFVSYGLIIHKNTHTHMRDLVKSIKDAFEMAGVQIGDAINERDAERRNAIQSKLLKKIKLFRARIHAAYYFYETGGKYARKKVDPYSSCLDSVCLDSVIELITMEYELDYEEEWKSVGKGLKLIQIFLTLVPKWSDADKVVGEHLGDLVSCIEGSFKTACSNIENAIKKGDGEFLDALSTNILEKIELLNPRIREAYEFLSDYAFQTTPHLPPITDPKIWSRFCNLLACNGYYWLNALTLNEEFTDTMCDLERFGNVYMNDTSESDSEQLRGLGSFIQGVVIYLAGCIFRWWVEMNEEDGKMISDLLQKIYPEKFLEDELHAPEPCSQDLDRLMATNLPHTTSSLQKLQDERNYFLRSVSLSTPQKLLEDELHPPGLFSPKDLNRLVGIILPATNSSLQTLRNGLRYLLQPEDVRLMRSDIEKIVLYAASLSYPNILAGPGNDELTFQLLQKIILVNVELVLGKLVGGIRSISIGTFEPIYTGLTSVQAFFDCAPDVYSPRLKSIFKHIEQLARQAESLLPQFLAENISEECREPNALELKLYLDFMQLKIQAYLTEQMRCSPCLMVFMEDKIHALDEGLELLFKFLSLLPSNKGDEELILTYLRRFDEMETPPYNFSLSNQVSELFINEMSVFLSTLVQDVSLMNSEIQDSALQFQSSIVLILPKTRPGFDFVHVFLEKLSKLMFYQADSVGSSMKDQIEVIIKELDSMRCFLLTEVGEERKEDLELKDILGRVIWTVYKADYIIDWIVRVKCDWNYMLWLSNVVDEMKLIKSELTKFAQMKNNFAGLHGVIHPYKQVIITKTIAPQVGEVVIALEDQEDTIINRLTIGLSGRREVVTILGMAGIGKTTLAKKVYDNPRVKSHFHRLSWCCVSQVYRRREVLLNILSDITKASTYEMDKKTDEELLQMLYQSLKGKRYLIVLDDVWGTEAWEELRNAFSDDQKGSRILITTRNEEVGLKCQHDGVPHVLRFLNLDESWKLLQEKVFHKDECPDDLLKVGMEIAEGCKGLPLAIVAIAGILKLTEKNVGLWKQIERDLNSHILKNPEIQCMHILELSYNHLPDDLRPCFLYFAAFGEDSEVSVQKLIKLWIAEGFIREVDDQKALPEDVGVMYVQNLIARSLLVATKRGSGGRVKTCKVHDMLHKMCLRKVEEENFLQYINGYEKLFPSSTNQLDYGVDSEYSPISVAYNQHRLSICSKRKHFVMLKPCGPTVRTLLFSATSDTYPRCPYDDMLFISENFKILNILDIESINIGSSFPEGMEMIYPLRYLAISGDIRSVPSTVAKLWNLETFIVKGLMGKVVLPDTIWNMSRLRHLHVSTQAILSLQSGSISSCPQLHNMVSLSCPSLSHGDNSTEMMKLFPKLRNLKCTFSERVQHSEKSILFPILDFLVELESLKVSYYGNLRQYCQLKGVSFPLNLKRLSLSDFRFTWNDFSAIGKLPSLEILKLVSIAFDTPTWEMKDDEFLQLKYLKLESLKIVEWNALSDHLPSLEQLVLRSCMQLEEIPCSFGEIPTLQMIELKWCSGSAEKSIVTIQEQQLDYGNNEFKVFINGSLQIPVLP